jgi:hypothetical protein
MNTTLPTMPVRNGNYSAPRLPQFRVTVLPKVIVDFRPKLFVRERLR